MINIIKIIIKNNFNLKDTVTCGQIFRFTKEEDNGFTIILFDRVINIKEENNELIILSNKEENLREIVINYFDLDRNYELINKTLSKYDKKIIPIIEKCDGFKMIKQSSFETIISYIISANNNVRTITKVVNTISENYGEKVIFNNKEYYLFPNAKDLKNVSIEDFRNMKTGFRAEYLVSIIKAINEGTLDLNDIYNMNTEESLNLLISYKGIGIKVASCILLFAYQKFDVFPIDTWVKKIMEEEYNLKDVNKIKEYAIKNYKEYSAIAIQYMYHAKRNK